MRSMLRNYKGRGRLGEMRVRAYYEARFEEDGMYRSRAAVRLFGCIFAVAVCGSFPAPAQQAVSGAGKALTVERIYSQPSLSGRLTRGLEWMPDGKQLSYFETKGAGKEAKTELWLMDAAKGDRKLLIDAEKLASLLPSDAGKSN